ncbi:beta strand repeat-containing protein [Heyndrickxia acidicola]|uniref:Ig-like domain-containing protein n=1 Tax=Heyndrickxia acidicola TaxID=209389 RepID=A0ABU6MFW0_9BACI|nr:Ig-like domain-containing protein [Heyndrickxia acidicola]MED1203289.1 Ig-like domain-containing protein [Heyndrickxia acidicola]
MHWHHVNLPYSFKDGSTVASFTYGGHYYKSVKLSTPYAPGVKTVTVTGPKQIMVVFTDGVTKTVNLPYRFKAGSTVTSFSYFGHNYSSVKLSTAYAPKVTSAVALNEKSIKVVFENGETETVSLPYRFKDGSTEASFTFAGISYKSVKLDTPYVATVNSIGTLDDITINQGDDASKVLPATVKEMLSNGTSKDVNVTWDTTKLDVNTPATYALTGKVDGTDKTASVNVIVKSVAPQVTGVSAINGTQLLVKFNKPVNADTTTTDDAYTSSAANLANYSLSGSNKIDSAVVQADGKSVVLTLDAPVANTTSATYTLTVSGVTLADATTVVPTYAGVVNVSDTTAPTVTAATASTNGATTNSATLTFSKPVTSLTAIKIDGTVVSSSDYKVTTGTTTLQINGLSLDSSQTHSIEVVGLTDASGNVNSDQTSTLTITKDVNAPMISSVTANGDKSLEITFNKQMGTVPSSSFTLKDEAYNDLGTVTVNADPADTTGTKYIATFNEGSSFFTNSNTRNLTLVVSGTGVTDYVGNVLAATTKTVSLTKDTTLPAVTGVTVQKNSTTGAVTSFTVNFNKALNAGTISSSNVTLVDSNGILLDTTTAGTKVISDATVKAGDTKAVFNVANGAMFSGQYSFDLAAKSVTDQSYTGNQNAEYSTTVDTGTSSVGTFTDTASATSTPISGVVSNVIKVTYSTPVKGGLGAGSATQPSNYTINGTALPAGTVITLDSTQKVATITLPAGSFTTTDTAAVFKVNGVVSTTGATLSPSTQLLTVTDNVAPVLKNATVNADNSLSLGFDSTVASAASADLKDLVVTVNGNVLPTSDLVIKDGSGADTGKYVITDSNVDFTKANSIVVGTAATTANITDVAGNVVTAGTTITVK